MYYVKADLVRELPKSLNLQKLLVDASPYCTVNRAICSIEDWYLSSSENNTNYGTLYPLRKGCNLSIQLG